MRLLPFLVGTHGDLLRPLAARLGERLGTRVEIGRPRFDPTAAFEPRRGQYDSRRLLQLLLEESDAPRVLGITAVDLCIPVLSYVFGEAQLGGRAAVVSLFRLEDERYGIRPRAGRLAERALKEALHELGHTFGLVHCDLSDCVMHASTYVEDIDVKPARFCASCARSVPRSRSA